MDSDGKHNKIKSYCSKTSNTNIDTHNQTADPKIRNSVCFDGRRVFVWCQRGQPEKREGFALNCLWNFNRSGRIHKNVIGIILASSYFLYVRTVHHPTSKGRILTTPTLNFKLNSKQNIMNFYIALFYYSQTEVV